MDMPRAATMNELAKLAGVSISTVSRALAGNPVINQQTRDKVVALAHAHGFQPNLLARNLRLRRSETIGVALPLGHQADQHAEKAGRGGGKRSQGVQWRRRGRGGVTQE